MTDDQPVPDAPDVPDVPGTAAAPARPHLDRRQTGPVTLRGHKVPATTTDQRLLERRQRTDWLHADPWRVMRIQSEFVEGFGTLSELGPAVAVFGSARMGADHPAYAMGVEVGRLLAEAGYAVITGGGPGDPNLAHTREEHCSLSAVTECEKRVRDWLQN